MGWFLEEKKKEPVVRKGIFQWLFQAALLTLGTVIALSVALSYLEPIWPYLLAFVVLIAAIWVVIAVARWRRGRW
ncbi:MAG: hypothetical protein VB036_05235 [Propionicimonas sp.]|nr:hypothetical protein [Propionicimonas sp.]